MPIDLIDSFHPALNNNEVDSSPKTENTNDNNNANNKANNYDANDVLNADDTTNDAQPSQPASKSTLVTITKNYLSQLTESATIETRSVNLLQRQKKMVCHLNQHEVKLKSFHFHLIVVVNLVI